MIAPRFAAAVLFACAAACPIYEARAGAVEDFYKGKTVSLVIGYSAGGGYDLYARLLAHHLGKHIPGKPSVVPQNMTGAGSLRAANFLYYVAPKDGSTIGTFARGMGIAPLLGGAQYDGTKFSWLGSMTSDVSLCLGWTASSMTSWDDMLNRPSNFGGEGPGSDPDIFAQMFKNVFGAKLKLITGYPGTAEMTLAMERGELDGLCGISWSTVKARHMQWIKQRKIAVLVQAALEKDPDLPDVPLAIDLTKDPEKLLILKMMLGPQEMARPFAAPPDIPDDRRKALIKAFAETLTDPEFLDEASKLSLDTKLVSAATIDALLAELYKTPKNIIDKAIAAIAK